MYQHGKRSRRKDTAKTYLNAAVILGVALIIAALILQKDLATNSDERTTVPIITEVKSDKEEKQLINEPLFTMELPSDWRQTNRVQESYANYYEWASGDNAGGGRRLLLHINIMPGDYKLVRMLPLTPDGNSFIVGNISGNCINFAKDAGTRQRAQGNEPVEAKWENVTFMCDPINANQTVGTGTPEGTIGTELGRNKYYFYYEDHNVRPDDKILEDALQSFKIR